MKKWNPITAYFTGESLQSDSTSRHRVVGKAHFLQGPEHARLPNQQSQASFRECFLQLSKIASCGVED